jgi:hypothetical protein
MTKKQHTIYPDLDIQKLIIKKLANGMIRIKVYDKPEAPLIQGEITEKEALKLAIALIQFVDIK